MPGGPHLLEHVRDELHVRAGQDREPHAVHVLGHGRSDDLLRGQPDSLVDDLEAGVAGAYGDLLGAVGVSVEPGLPDEQPQPSADLLAGGLHLLADLGELLAGLGHADRSGDAGRCTELPEHLTQRAGPLPRGRPRASRDEGRLHQVVVGLRGLGERCERAVDLLLVTLLAPGLQAGDRRALGLGVRCLDRGVEVSGQRRGLGGLEPVHADDDVVAVLDGRATSGVGADQRLLHVAGLDGRDRPAERLHAVDLRAGVVHELADLGLDHLRAVEDVVVLQQVGLEGQHLLQPQRPLLVPGTRQAEGLVPRRQLYGAGAGVLGQGDAEHLEHDPLDVVLRLGLGQPERVDLHAVPEAAHLGVLDAVALAGDLVPQLARTPASCRSPR